jgi:hypothetical protein
MTKNRQIDSRAHCRKNRIGRFVRDPATIGSRSSCRVAPRAVRLPPPLEGVDLGWVTCPPGPKADLSSTRAGRCIVRRRWEQGGLACGERALIR